MAVAEYGCGGQGDYRHLRASWEILIAIAANLAPEDALAMDRPSG